MNEAELIEGVMTAMAHVPRTGPDQDVLYDEACAAIAEYRAALAEAGLVVVPREPTEAMVYAGGHADPPDGPYVDGPADQKSVERDDRGCAEMTEGRGELGSDAALPDGPYAIGLTHTPQGDSPPWTVTAADQRAIAGHVPSKAIADAIAFAMNLIHPPPRPKRAQRPQIPSHSPANKSS